MSRGRSEEQATPTHTLAHLELELLGLQVRGRVKVEGSTLSSFRDEAWVFIDLDGDKNTNQWKGNLSASNNPVLPIKPILSHIYLPDFL